MNPLPVTGETEITEPENRLVYPALDGARAIAFLMVFLEHYCNLPWGWAGVDLFFVLSGFLITGILYDTRAQPHRARTFYIRRTLRIFPLYYAVLLLLLVSTPLLHWMWNWHWLVWPLYIGNFLQLVPLPDGSALQRLANFWLNGSLRGHPVHLFLGHFWSLAVEEQFYLVWPWVAFLVRDRRKLVWICLASLPLCLAARLIAWHALPPAVLLQGALFSVTPFRVDALLAGGLLALLLRGPHQQLVLRTSRWLLPVIAGCVFLLLLLSPTQRTAWMQMSHICTIGLSCTAIFSAVLVAHILQPQLLLSRALSIRPLRWAGRISYGAYIFHDIFHLNIAHLGESFHPAPVAGTIVVGLTFTYTLAWLSFRFFETPFLNLKNRWAPALAKPTL